MNTLPPQPRKPVTGKALEKPAQVEMEPNQNAAGIASAATSPIPTKLSAPSTEIPTTQPSLPLSSPSYTNITPGPSRMEAKKEEEVPETTAPAAATSYPSPEIVTIEYVPFILFIPATLKITLVHIVFPFV